jgi:hypothetical protein
MLDPPLGPPNTETVTVQRLLLHAEPQHLLLPVHVNGKKTQ